MVLQRWAWLALGVFVLSACQPSLDVPGDAKLTCEDDSDCPGDGKCRSGFCVSVNTNLRPGVSIGAVERGTELATARLRVTDPEGDEVSWSCELLVSGSVTGSVVVTPSSVRATPVGADVDVSFALSSLIGTNYQEGLTLRLVPVDAGGEGEAAVSEAFAFGNDAPTASGLVVSPDPARGAVVVSFDALDTAADPLHLARFTFAADGDLASPDLDLDLESIDASTRASLFPAGNLTEMTSGDALPAPGTPVSNFFLWDTLADPASRVGASAARLRLVLRDAYDGEVTVDSAAFALANQSAPRVEGLTAPLADRAAAGGGLPIFYRLVDEQLDVADVRVEFSADQGDHWHPCAEYADLKSEGPYDLATAPSQALGDSGVPHVFFWDVAANLFDVQSPVRIRVTAADTSGVGPSSETALANDAGVAGQQNGFASGLTTAALAQPFALAYGDVVFGAEPDLTLLGETSGSARMIEIYAADATGQPSLALSCPGDGAQGLALADLDGLLGPDLIYTVPQDRELHVRALLDRSAADCAQHFEASVTTSFANDAVDLASSSVDIEVADMDDDGDTDVVVAWVAPFTPSSSGIDVFLNDGGALALVTSIDTGSLQSQARIALGDIDGDGAVDAVSVGSGGLRFWQGDGAGALAQQGPYLAPKDAAGLEIADLDLDGKRELLAASANTLFVYHGSSAGPVDLVNYELGGYAVGLSIIDLNGDASADVATAVAQNDGTVSGRFWLAQAPGAELVRGGELAPTNAALSTLMVAGADLTGDGLSDLAMVTDFPELEVLAAKRASKLPASALSATEHVAIEGISPTRLTMLDVDEDGIEDIFFVDAGAGMSGYARGLGSLGTSFGRFALEATEYHDGGSLPAVAFCDLDLDGRLDMVGTPYIGTSEGVFLSVGYDIAGQLMGEAFELTSFAEYGYISALGCADISGDGRPDVLAAALSASAVDIYVQNPNGTFAAPLSVPTLASPQSFAVADVAGDALPDIVALTWDTMLFAEPNRRAEVLEQTGALVFATASPISCKVGDDPVANTFYHSAVLTRDADSDGDTDVIVVMNTVPSVALDAHLCVAHNEGGTLTTAIAEAVGKLSSGNDIVFFDATADGLGEVMGGFPAWISTPRIDLQPQLTLVEDFGITQPYAFDVDDDGTTDLVSVTGAGSGGSFGVTRFRRNDPRGSWRMTLANEDPRLPRALPLGDDTLPASLDRFGASRTAGLSARPRSGVDDLANLARKSALADLLPLTQAWELSGELRLTRVLDESGDTAPSAVRLRLEPRLGPVVAGTPSGLALPTRGITVELPLGSWIDAGALGAASEVRVFLQRSELVRAADFPDDALANTSAGAAVLPKVAGKSIFRTSTTLVELPAEQVELVLDKVPSRVRLTLDELGAVQAFLSP